MSIALFVIGRQPECYPHVKKFLIQHAFLSPALDCMCKDKLLFDLWTEMLIPI